MTKNKAYAKIKFTKLNTNMIQEPIIVADPESSVPVEGTEFSIESTPKELDPESFVDQLRLAVILAKIHKNLSRGDRNKYKFTELFEIYSDFKHKSKALARFVFGQLTFLDDFGGVTADERLSFLSIDVLASKPVDPKKPDFSDLVRPYRDSLESNGNDVGRYWLTSVISPRTEIFSEKDGSPKKPVGCLASLATREYIRSGGRAPVKEEKEKKALIDSNIIAFHYFEVLKIIYEYQPQAAPAIPKITGKTINEHLKELLVAGHALGFNPFELIRMGSFSNEGKGTRLLGERIIGLIQEINGYNLFEAAIKGSSRYGTKIEDDNATDTVHNIDINNQNYEVDIDWKSSYGQITKISKDKNCKIINNKINIGKKEYNIYLVCTLVSGSKLKLTAFLSDSNKQTIESIKDFELSNNERTALKERLVMILSSFTAK